MKCDKCGDELEIGMWPWCPHSWVKPQHHGIHERERAVVWKHPITGHVVYPGRNDVPMPERYAKVGYCRHELGSIQAIHKHEKTYGVSSEIAHFDKGTGRGFDEQDDPGLPKETIDLLRSGAIKVRNYDPNRRD